MLSALPCRARLHRFGDVQWRVGLRLGFAAYRQQPPSRYGDCHPQPFCSRRILHACVLPLPTTAFAVFEALFYPSPQPIPTGIRAFRRQIGHHQPRVLMSFAPATQQGTVQPSLFAGKRGASALITRPLTRHTDGKWLPAMPTLGTKRALAVDT